MKRIVPILKVCERCGKQFKCTTREQIARNRFCSRSCAASRKRKRKPMSERAMTQVKCAVCGKLTWRYNCHLARTKQPVCSYHCNGVLRGKEWAKHAHKGRAAWTEANEKSCREKMTGERNPAWKGGVTYRKRHGLYANQSIKFVRCPLEFVGMARKDGYVMQHRLLVAQELGRPLERRECVHHINHNAEDNRLENLQLFSSNQHHKLYEHHGKPPPIWGLDK